MNRYKYRAQQIANVLDVLHHPSKDRDVDNLKMILYSIDPDSLWWRRGYVRSLKRAIKALELEGEQT
jgi:hypothetical protein